MPIRPQRLAAPPETADDEPVTTVMTAHLVRITPDAQVSTALRLMASTGVRHLPVLAGQQCLGVAMTGHVTVCADRAATGHGTEQWAATEALRELSAQSAAVVVPATTLDLWSSSRSRIGHRPREDSPVRHRPQTRRTQVGASTVRTG